VCYHSQFTFPRVLCSGCEDTTHIKQWTWWEENKYRSFKYELCINFYMYNKSPLKIVVLWVQMWTTGTVSSQNMVKLFIAFCLSNSGLSDSYYFCLSSGVICCTNWTLCGLRHSVLWNAWDMAQLEMLSSRLAHLNHCFGTVQETDMYTQQLGLMQWIVLVECLTPSLCMA
jgi:hypothetical protein